MKRFSIVAICTVVFAAALLCVKPLSSLAQQSTQNEWRQIKLHNVRPDIMAYFIDPKHQKQPIEFKIATMYDPSHSSQEQEEMDAMKSGAPEFTFDGVVAADNSQNALWIFSTQKTFDQTKLFVDFLDKPIPQVELGLQVVKVSTEDLKTFQTQPIQPLLKNSSDDFPYKFGILTTDSRIALHSWGTLQATLQKLVTQGKAKIVNSPRVTTLNHLKASLATATTIPVFLGIKDENNSYVPLAVDSNNNHQIGITKQLRVAFTPDINESAKTITVNLDVSADEGITNVEIKDEKGFNDHIKRIWFHNQLDPPLVATINVADNQVIVITGLDTTMLGLDDKHDNVALFLTARIIHRTD